MTSPCSSLTRMFAVAVLAASMAFALTACGSDSDGTSTDSGQEIVTGPAKCSQLGIEEAVNGWAKGEKTKADLPKASGSYKCADGWAVAFPNVGKGKNAVTVTLVFEAEGPVLVPQDRSKVCGKDSPVPKKLYKAACQTN